MKQITDTVLMIRPISFRMNEETAVNNYFQRELKDITPEAINANAQKEFDAFVEKLTSVGIYVVVVDDLLENNTPDSIFPNNWVSFHQNGDIVLYPMFSINRRLERREDIFEILENKGFRIESMIDYTSAELDDVFLEGTGSIVLDRAHKVAYCALSSRADEDLFIEFCEDLEFTPVVFQAFQTVGESRLPIYHTNVMMCVAETFAVICLDTIDDKSQRKHVVNKLKEQGKEIISITEDQMEHFAGNMLQVQGKEQKYLVMSSTAYNSLLDEQIEKIEKHCSIIHSSLNTIEVCGGGSARCMMAEVFLPKK